jgi:hypothetical protein
MSGADNWVMVEALRAQMTAEAWEGCWLLFSVL